MSSSSSCSSVLASLVAPSRAFCVLNREFFASTPRADLVRAVLHERKDLLDDGFHWVLANGPAKRTRLCQETRATLHSYLHSTAKHLAAWMRVDS